MVWWWTISCLLLLIEIRADYTPEALQDRISDLPGAEALNLTFNQFSGYLHVDGVDVGKRVPKMVPGSGFVFFSAVRRRHSLTLRYRMSSIVTCS